MEYTRTYIRDIVHASHEGGNRDRLLDIAQGNDLQDLNQRKMLGVAGHLNKGIASWVKMEGLELRELVKLDSSAWERKKESLLNVLDRAVRDYVLDKDFLPDLYATRLLEVEKQLNRGPLMAAQKKSLIKQFERGDEKLRVEVWH